MRIIEHIREMQNWSDAKRREGRSVVLVPTMGFLHEGHLELIRDGRKRGDELVVSIFVNPTQFAPHEDYGSYPRNFERDSELLAKESVDLLFHPVAGEMYPKEYQTYIAVERLSSDLCGALRPGHFRGVATVVAKLFHIVRPHVAIFGAKDFQQLQVIRRMVTDLNFDLEVVGHPLVREGDGLAMSSRNTYLSQEERRAALSLHRSLLAAESMVRAGERGREPIINAVRAELGKDPLVRVEYVQLCDPERLEEIKKVEGESLLALAAWIGKTRLIDNTILRP
ncbi:MAG: pantoate--beta-alanine ligase [Candidatus Binatia bacterium]